MPDIVLSSGEILVSKTDANSGPGTDIRVCACVGAGDEVLVKFTEVESAEFYRELERS